MKTALLLTIGATPGAAVGYFFLMSYLLRKIQPFPITLMPQVAESREARVRERVAA